VDSEILAGILIHETKCCSVNNLGSGSTSHKGYLPAVLRAAGKQLAHGKNPKQSSETFLFDR